MLAETYRSPGSSDWHEERSSSGGHFNLPDVARPPHVFDQNVHPIGAAGDNETHAACVRAWNSAERTQKGMR